MNLKQLNNLNLENFKLEFACSEKDFILLLKVPNEEALSFVKNDSSDIFIQITSEDNLNLYINTIKDMNYRIGLEIPKNEKFSTNIKELYTYIKDKSSITMVIFSEKYMHYKKLNILSNDLETMHLWLSNISNNTTETYHFKSNYSSVPKGYLIPQQADNNFWFISIVSEENLTLAKENINNLTLKADRFEGELVLYLTLEKTLISVLQLADNIIDDAIREDFKILLKQSSISILLNTEGASDSNVVNITTTLDKPSIDTIKYYLSN